MDLLPAIPPPTKFDVATSVEDAAIALTAISLKYSSSPPSVLECSGDRGPNISGIVTKSSFSCDTRTTSTTKSKALKSREYIQLATLCLLVYLEGWNDGTNGPLLPRIQRVYGIGYTVVSLIFVFACLGFIIGALSNVILTEKLGFGKVVILGALFEITAYSINCFVPPFPAFLFAHFINGIGLALQNAQSVSYVASFKENPEAKMGILMAAYGGGALSAPLVATQFSQLKRWSFHYLVSLGIALINTVALILVFRFGTQEDCLAQIGIPSEPRHASKHSYFRQILSLKEVHVLALFTLLYVGAEVTIGSWIITYIIDVRGGGASSGYISTGFFAGLMVGRLALLWVNAKIGERLALIIYAMCAIGLEFVIWFVPSLIGDAVAIAAIGFLMGPMYPIAMNQGNRVLPRWLLTGAIGFVAGSGHAGSALLPFMAGAIASKAGIATLQPVLVVILVLMTVIWGLVPTKRATYD